MSKVKVNCAIIQEGPPLILYLTKNGRGVSKAVAQMYVAKHYPNIDFEIITGRGHSSKATEILVP